MSSPFRRSDHSRSSPVRHRINGLHHSRTHSHSTQELDGYCEEMSRLHIDTEKAYQKLLDERAREQKQKHLEGLDRALEKHELVQRSARECVERIQLEQQQVRLRQEQEERRRLEEERRKLEETRRKIAEEEQRRQDAERKKRDEEHQAEMKRKQDEEAAQKAAEQKRKEAEEARQKAEREKAAAEQEAKDKAVAEQAARNQQQLQTRQLQQTQQTPAQPAPAVVNGAPTHPALSSITSDDEERQKVHDAYMDIHRRLKEVRQTVRKAMEDNQALKASLAEATSAMKKNVGQISRKDKKGNKEKIQNVIHQIDQSLAINQPTDITQFMYNPTPVQPIQGPLILVYMLNIFSKCIIQQIDTEVGSLSDEKGEGADALGIAVALIFSNPKYLIDGRPLIDILWATYRHNSPRIFGVRVRGLPKNPKNVGALAAGFAAITLRQFPTGRVNPAPNRMFWETLARIVNVPRKSLRKDHLRILESMLQPTFVGKFIQIYGAAALAAIRYVIMDLAPAVRENNPDLRSEATGVYDLRLVLDQLLHLPLL